MKLSNSCCDVYVTLSSLLLIYYILYSTIFSTIEDRDLISGNYIHLIIYIKFFKQIQNVQNQLGID